MSSKKQAYAPTPHSYVPNTFPSATISLDEEVRLAETRAERDLQESLAEVFSILITLDAVEKAFLKDAIPAPEYTDQVERLLYQYKQILADETVSRAFVGLEEFKRLNGIDIPRATERIRVGMPSTTIREPTGVSTPASGVLPSSLGVPGSGIGINSAAASASGPAGGASAALILEATENFITFLDALKLSFRAKDQLHPLLSEVIQAVNKVAPDFEDRGKIVQWLIRLNQMKATDELDDDQARELELDMNQAYQGFKSILSR